MRILHPPCQLYSNVSFECYTIKTLFWYTTLVRFETSQGALLGIECISFLRELQKHVFRTISYELYAVCCIFYVCMYRINGWFARCRDVKCSCTVLGRTRGTERKSAKPVICYVGYTSMELSFVPTQWKR